MNLGQIVNVIWNFSPSTRWIIVWIKFPPGEKEFSNLWTRFLRAYSFECARSRSLGWRAGPRTRPSIEKVDLFNRPLPSFFIHWNSFERLPPLDYYLAISAYSFSNLFSFYFISTIIPSLLTYLDRCQWKLFQIRNEFALFSWFFFFFFLLLPSWLIARQCTKQINIRFE